MTAPNPVPCNGCTLCCQSDVITLSEAEAAFLPSEPHQLYSGQRMLAHKPNGDCVFLGPSGCENYAGRPARCREMDCRLVYRSLAQENARRLNAHAVWIRGRQLGMMEEENGNE